MMTWSPEDALNTMWTEMDSRVSNGKMRAFLKRHLQAAHDAGVSGASAATKAYATGDVSYLAALYAVAKAARHFISGEWGRGPLVVAIDALNAMEKRT